MAWGICRTNGGVSIKKVYALQQNNSNTLASGSWSSAGTTSGNTAQVLSDNTLRTVAGIVVGNARLSAIIQNCNSLFISSNKPKEMVYKKLYVDYETVVDKPNSGRYQQIGLTDDYITTQTSDSRRTVSFNISTKSTFTFMTNGWSDFGGVYCYIYNVWLEK